MKNTAAKRAWEGYTEKGKAKTIGKGSAKAPPKPAGVMKVAMKTVKKAVAMKAAWLSLRQHHPTSSTF